MPRIHLPAAGMALAAGLALFSSTAVNAELGKAEQSISADEAHLRAKLHKVPKANYTLQDLALPNGGVVHEFTNASGQVFAVTWNGPGKPDLRSLLGSHFADLQAASARPHGGRDRFRRMPAAVDRADLKIMSGGHMGWFWGVAYLPALAPPGFDENSLRP